MKAHFLPAIMLTFCCIVLFCGMYTAAVWGIAQLAPGKGQGEIINYGGNKGQISNYGYLNIGQAFNSDRYFQPRPSAVNYNAAGSGATNKGPTNPAYIKHTEAAVDTFLRHNPGITKSQIPSELVTASGSGLDPDISPDGARVQVPRIARLRGMKPEEVTRLVTRCTTGPLFGFLGPAKVNVLRINIELDKLK